MTEEQRSLVKFCVTYGRRDAIEELEARGALVADEWDFGFEMYEAGIETVFKAWEANE